MKLPEEEISGDKEVPFVDHKNDMGCSKKLICSDSLKPNADFHKAGDATQVKVAGPEPIQQNDGTNALIDDTAKCEQVINRQGDEAFQPDEGWKKMKLDLEKIDVFKEACRRNGKGGLYDAFINATERRKLLLHKYVNLLEQYWEPRVKYMEKNPQIQGTPEWLELLHVGNRVRMVIEPLKIASCFRKKGRNDYSRPEYLQLLEEWEKNGRKGNLRPPDGPSNSKRQKIQSPQEDSCFWVHVEKARKLLSSGGPSDDSERNELVKVDNYVVGLIDNSAVSADIFLENSTFMQWWRESEAIWEKQMMKCPRHGGLVNFMKNDPRRNYLNGVNSDKKCPDAMPGPYVL